MKTQYDTRTDAVIYGCDATRDFTQADWARLASAALDQAGLATPANAVAAFLAEPARRHAIEEDEARHGMYLGALVALGVSNLGMASDLAKLTRSTDEATKVVILMRDARDGDRVWPALEWLRAQRRVSP
jgi:hypothetical protein